MTEPIDPRPRLGGGLLLALAVLIGAAIGIARGQPSLGVLGGAAAGIVLAVAVWLYDRRAR